MTIEPAGYVIYNDEAIYDTAPTQQEAVEKVEQWLSSIPEEMERPEIAPATAALIAQIGIYDVRSWGELDGVLCTIMEYDADDRI